jgi:hypothetical protein
MPPLSTLPSAREQVHHVLTLLGVPAPASLIVDVHGALFDGDLSMGALGGLLRDEERTFRPAMPGSAYRLCRGLQATGLTAAPGLVALSTWPLTCRIVTPASARLDALTAIVRVAEFVAVQAGSSRAATRLLRELAAAVPGGPEAYDVMTPGSLADAARAAVAAAQPDADADLPARQAAAARAAQLDERHRLFGVPVVPHQTRREGPPKDGPA